MPPGSQNLGHPAEHRWVGRPVEPGVRRVAVEIIFVTDPTLIRDRAFTYKKCSHVAIGLVDDVSGEVRTHSDN